MNDNIQVIGIDVTDDRDFTAITGMCGKRHTVIDVKLYDPNINQINFLCILTVLLVELRLRDILLQSKGE